MEVDVLLEEVQGKSVEEYGKVTFADEVIATIAGVAALEVAGVTSMSGGIVEKFGRKSPSKGVKVEVGEKEAAIDLYMVIDYGVQIPEVAWNVQENVKKSIEIMTGLSVIEVNIYIQGIDFHKEARKVDPANQ